MEQGRQKWEHTTMRKCRISMTAVMFMFVRSSTTEVTMATVVGIKVSTVVGSRLDDINECVWELDIGTTS